MQIQNYLTCAIQNIRVFIQYATKPSKWAAARALAVETSFTQALTPLRRCPKTSIVDHPVTADILFKERSASRPQGRTGYGLLRIDSGNRPFNLDFDKGFEILDIQRKAAILFCQE